MSAHRRAVVVDPVRQRSDHIALALRARGLDVTVFTDVQGALTAHRAAPFLLAALTVNDAAAVVEHCRAFTTRPSVGALLALVPPSLDIDPAALINAGATDVHRGVLDVEDLALRVLVAERKASKKSLAEALLSALPDLVFCISRRGEFTDFRAPPGHELYAPPDRIIGGRVAALLPPLVAARTLQAVERVLATGALEVFDYSLPLRQGVVDYEARVVPSGDDDVLVLVRDNTSKRKAFEATRNLAALEERARGQEKLLQVQKAESLGLLAGGIAHDFNNLLTAIMGHASVASLKLTEGSSARRSIDALVVAARRAADLTQQLLAYSGKGRFQIRLIDLSAHIREIVTLLEAATPKSVHLRLDLTSDLPAIECDASQIQQVVMNLVINAAEAIPDRGTVLVTTGRQSIPSGYPADALDGHALAPGEYVFVEVHDDGKGMDDATRARIFDPFFTTKGTGRGLGLAAVLGIVRSHNGGVRVYSSVGRGTTFKVLFPAQSAPPELDPPRAAAARGSGVVLVVDDEALLRRAARSILEHFGFRVIEAANGEEAVKRFEAAPDEIAAVLLDMTMPGLTGEETFRRLRAIRTDVTVVLSSGYNEIEATRRFTSKGLAGFLQKPYTADQLGEAISSAIAARPSRAAL